jgi:sigma-B regulation protein RsbU (phosphoserine phosphatase)
MTRFTLFRLKNRMFFGNFLANLIGVQMVQIVTHRSVSSYQPDIQNLVAQVNMVFIPLAFLTVAFLTVLYERPIRLYLSNTWHHREVSSEVRQTARRRLLNEPFVLIAFDLSIWLLAAIVYPTFFHYSHFGHMVVVRAFIQTILVGLITAIAAFFVLERALQKKLIPYFFPDGGLHNTPRTLRIRISTRLAALLFACNLIPFIAFLAILSSTYRSGMDPAQLVDLLRPAILTNSIIFIAVGLLVTVLVSSNLTRPFDEIIHVLKSVRNGHLDRKVRVTSNDEIGYTGDVINDMTEGLKEREKMRQSLELAREVQQRLLPESPPRMKGVDIAGKSIYCDQTGGDYFDYFDYGQTKDGPIGLVIGDVCGHGIPSALLMATARAFLRLRSFMPGSIAQIVTDVNRQLVRDVEDSGQFITLFYIIVDPAGASIRWVRAGHEPAMLYDPHTDNFKLLGGAGIALGVDQDWVYEEQHAGDLSAGQVMILSTDGIWEARNPSGEMFGKKRLYDIIRSNHAAGADEILNTITVALHRFQEGAALEDDVTMVVVKIGDT